MVSMMVASAREHFSVARRTAVQNAEQKWPEHKPLPTTLPHVGFFRALPTIHLHERLHGVADLADNSEQPPWHAKTEQGPPTEGFD